MEVPGTTTLGHGAFVPGPRLRQLRPVVQLNRRDSDKLAIEVVMLRHEVAVFRRQGTRPALDPTDRALLAGLSRLFDRTRRGRVFVQRETLLRRHRDRFGFAGSSPPTGTTEYPRRHRCHRGPAGPENPPWGCRRIQLGR